MGQILKRREGLVRFDHRPYLSGAAACAQQGGLKPWKVSKNIGSLPLLHSRRLAFSPLEWPTNTQGIFHVWQPSVRGSRADDISSAGIAMEKRNGLASVAPHALRISLEALEAALLTQSIHAAQDAISVAKLQLEALQTVALQAEAKLQAENS